MPQRTFISEIHNFVLVEWCKAIHEGEEKYSRLYDDEIGTPSHIAKIKDFAQLRLVSSLVTLKGAWLTDVEVGYTLDLFDKLCESFAYFDILEFHDSADRPGSLLKDFLQKGKTDHRDGYKVTC